MAALWNRAGHYIFALWFLSFFFLFFLAYSQRSEIGCLTYFYTWCGLRANLECRSEICCMRLAGNKGRKNDAKIVICPWSAHHSTNLSGCICEIKAYIYNQEKVLKHYVLHMSLKYCELLPTSGWDRFVSLGHPSEFQRVSRLGSVTARYSNSARQPNFAVLNRERHLYSAGRPSHWALAHIQSLSFYLAYSQSSQTGCLPCFHTWCGLSANLGSRSEACCTRLAENTGRKKSPIIHDLRIVEQHLSGYIFATEACIDSRRNIC